jgi:hypothetical protein
MPALSVTKHWTVTLLSLLLLLLLQIWDFDTGRPLEMRKNELCTASCMLNNGEHVVLGRTDRFGGSTTIVLWDVLGNEPIRTLTYDACLGLADHIR